MTLSRFFFAALALSLAPLQASLVYSESFSSTSGWSGGSGSISTDGGLSFGSFTELSSGVGVMSTNSNSIRKAVNLNLQNGQTYHMAWLMRMNGISSGVNTATNFHFNVGSALANQEMKIGTLNGSYSIENGWSAGTGGAWPKIAQGVAAPSDTTTLFYAKLIRSADMWKIKIWAFTDPNDIPLTEPWTDSSYFVGEGAYVSMADTLTNIGLTMWRQSGSANLQVDELRIATTFAEAVPSPSVQPLPAPISGDIVVWPLGDSLTIGEGGEPKLSGGDHLYHYRAYLQAYLAENNVTYDFVGTQSGGASFYEFAQMSDPEHEGHGGEGVEHFNTYINNWSNALPKTPDFITVMLGTNDYWRLTHTAALPEYIQLFTSLRSLYPNVHILVQGVGERTDIALLNTRAQMNTMLENAVADRVSSGDDKIYYLENLTTLYHIEAPNIKNDGGNTRDKIHPMDEGCELIALQFWNKMREILSAGSGAGSYADWLTANGMTSNTGETQDYDGDGLSNLLEYGLSLNPTSAERSTVFPSASEASNRVQITFVRDNAKGDIDLYVEESRDPAFALGVTTIAMSTAGGTLSGSGTVTGDSSSGAPSVTVRGTLDTSSEPSFLRIRIEK